MYDTRVPLRKLFGTEADNVKSNSTISSPSGSLISSENCSIITKGINKNYTIKVVPGNETDPVNLVKQTIEKVKELRLVLEDDDRAFCIFDTDVNPSKNVQIKEERFKKQ